MDIEAATHNGYTVVHVKNRLRFSDDISELRDRIIDLVNGGARNIVLCLELESRLNSEAIGMLVACVKTVAQHKGRFGIVRPTAETAEVFQIIGLLGHVELYASEEQLGEERCPMLSQCAYFGGGGGKSPSETRHIHDRYCTRQTRRCARWVVAACGKVPPENLAPDQIDEAIELL